jgi:hypothetical protein
VALNATPQDDKGRMVTREPVDAGDEEDLVLTGPGTPYEGEKHGPVLAGELRAVLDAAGRVSVRMRKRPGGCRSHSFNGPHS